MKIEMTFADKIHILRRVCKREGIDIGTLVGVGDQTLTNWARGVTYPPSSTSKLLEEITEGFIVAQEIMLSRPTHLKPSISSIDSEVVEKVRKNAKATLIAEGSPIQKKASLLRDWARSTGKPLHAHWGVTRMCVYNWLEGRSRPQAYQHEKVLANCGGLISPEELSLDPIDKVIEAKAEVILVKGKRGFQKKVNPVASIVIPANPVIPDLSVDDLFS
jgi:hypothetical protein